jgi:signal peptidase II
MKLNFFYKSIALFLAAMFFVGDRCLKILALVRSEADPLPLLGSWLTFDFTPNYHIAFSLPLGGIWLLWLTGIIIAGIISFVVYLFWKRPADIRFVWPLVFLLLGSISNFIDRLNLSYVVDYFSGRYFSVFNLADVMITGSVIWILILSYSWEKKR